MHTEAIGWTARGAVRLLDQTKLPKSIMHLEIETIDGMVEAIQMLRVRGAPLIGVAAAMGLAAAANRARIDGTLGESADAARTWLASSAAKLAAARPTAVNLKWAVDRVQHKARQALADAPNDTAGEDLVDSLWLEAQVLWDEDAEMCRAIGEFGAALVPKRAKILTVCNTGMLATGGIGTAFGVIRTAFEQGKVREVYACETRPLCQGSRLTAWELARLGIPSKVIVDGAAATVIAELGIDMVISGADRIAANGDSANKIGTRGLAVLASAHGVPFYVAAPRSTVDAATRTGRDIPIEERAASEVATATGVDVYNPAFDVTPADLIAGIITDQGVVRPPYGKAIRNLMRGKNPANLS